MASQFTENTTLMAFSALPFLCVLYVAALTIYRILWHPLARFPGPKLAGATGWYETYYDCYLLGKFSNHIDRMHEEYGPIVRINPWELHIKDPEFFDKIYTMTPKLDKDPWYYNFIGIPQSAFATPDSQLHRARRGATAKLFSASAALRMQPHIESCVAKMIAKLRSLAPGEAINMSHAYWCMANDVVTGCMMPQASGLTDDVDSAPRFGKMFKALAGIALRNRHFSWLFKIALGIPRSIIRKISPAAVLYSLDMEEDLISQITQTTTGAQTPHKTIPSEILTSPLPPSDKSIPRILQDATMIIGAGTEATGAALSITTYYLLASPAKTQRLRSELLSLSPLPPSSSTSYSAHNLLTYPQLQNSPYLSACIAEGLRLSKESNRMPRVNHRDVTVYKDMTIPAGSVVSMSLRDIHLDARIWERPREFVPERWLGESTPTSTTSNDNEKDNKDSKKKDLERFFAPFGKGSRGCVGRELAMVELYLAVGNLFRAVEMGLSDTGEEDIRRTHDFFSLEGGEGRGLRVVAI